MKWLVVLIVIAGLLLAGCPQPSEPPTAETPTTPPPGLYDKTWISPGKVEVGNFYPGARAEYKISIHNGSDEPAEFSVSYRAADNTAEGYEPAPAEAQAWVTIDDPAPVLAAKETRDVLIAVEMPDDAQAPPKWEFWIAAKDVTQTGMVQTELACRWLVEMK
ncbi:hypothetical protein ES708_13407 [subsurface metagenome]